MLRIGMSIRGIGCHAAAWRNRGVPADDLARLHSTFGDLLDIGRRHGAPSVIGAAQHIADPLQRRFENGARDGFNITPTHLPGGCDSAWDGHPQPEEVPAACPCVGAVAAGVAGATGEGCAGGSSCRRIAEVMSVMRGAIGFS